MTLVLDPGGAAEARIPVEEFPFHVGRASSNDLVLDDGLASRRHAVLLLEPDGVVLVDHNSSNGTWVNDELVTRSKLGPTDLVRMGNSRIAVAEIDAPADAPGQSMPPEIVLERVAQDLETSESRRQRLLGRPISDLAGSYIHMHCNRLLRSSHRPQEFVLYDLLGRVYESRQARERAKAKGAKPAKPAAPPAK